MDVTDGSGLGKIWEESFALWATMRPGFHAWLLGDPPCCPPTGELLQVPHLKEVHWAATVRYGDLLLPLSAGGDSSIKLRHFSSETQTQRY